MVPRSRSPAPRHEADCADRSCHGRTWLGLGLGLGLGSGLGLGLEVEVRHPAVEVVMVVKVAGGPSPWECDGNMSGQLTAMGRPMVGA